MLKQALALCLLFTAALAAAQSSVNIKLPAQGDYAVFGSHGMGTQPPSSPTAGVGGSLSLLLADGQDTVNVWDRTKGNVASMPAAKVKGGWDVKDSDFKNIAQVLVRVTHEDKPIAAGEVQLTDGLTRSSGIIDGKSDGTVAFFNVKPGTLKVDVHYRKAGGESDDVMQLFPLSVQRSDVVPKLQISIVQDVETAASTAPAVPATTAGATQAPASANPPVQGSGSPTAPQTANPFGTAIGYLFAFAVAIAIVYFAWRFMRNNPETVSTKLEQLGVQIPKPGDEGLSTATPVMPDPLPKAAPPQKIMLTNSAPDPMPVPGPSIAVSQPSLVAESGVAIPLAEGETVVGRDVGLGLSLSAETTVSRRHATLARMGNEVTLTDLGSTNGTYVNGAKLQTPTMLRAGDAVQFGSSRFQFMV